MNTQPTRCNLCGGEVVYISNAEIYGKEYGSGKAYLCKNCGAYVGTHKARPKEALGILANKEMRDLKREAHELFDARWLYAKDRRSARKECYKQLAKRMGIAVNECHFGWFDTKQLEQAIAILKGEDA